MTKFETNHFQYPIVNDYTFYFPARRRITITQIGGVQKVSKKVKRLRHLRIPQTMQYLALVNQLVFDFYILTFILLSSAGNFDFRSTLERLSPRNISCAQPMHKL